MSDNFPRPDGYPSGQPTPPVQDYFNSPLPNVYQAPEELPAGRPAEPQPPTGPEAALPAKRKTNWFRLLVRYAAIWLAVLLLVKFVVPSYEVKGSSMVPTYQPAGDRVLTDGVFFKLVGGPQRGDIVILDKATTPGADDEALIKRVIGLPGERLEIRKGDVYINGQLLSEPYIQNHADYSYPATVIPANNYFVLGDNRPVSLDSHYFGPVTRDQIVAKVLLTYPWRF
jgi:signal peptidase I